MKKNKTLLDKLLAVLNMAGNAVMMNLLFLVCCIPVVTIGQSWCALMSAIRYNIRGEKWFTGFKVGFKTRFWRGTIAWTVMLLLNVHMLLDLRYAYAEGYTVQLIASSLIFCLTSMVTSALMALNVYIPTSVGNWINNATAMVFKAPLVLLGAAVIFWLPALLALLWFEVFFYGVMIFLAVYYTVAALGTTMLLKGTLLQYLLAARADGTLLAEEGKQREVEEEDEDEDEYEEEEEA